MPLTPLTVPDTRPYFRPAAESFLDLLRSLRDRDWELPTAAGAWRVRDVLAHLVDTAFRRLSLDRDGHEWRPPDPPRGEADLAAFINRVNGEWVEVAARLSPRALIDLYALASLQLAAYVETVPLDAPARFPVSWAGETESQAWFDIGREFTEVWHHQMQIRAAVGAPPPDHPEWLRAVLQLAVRALPHAYRSLDAAPGTTIVIDVTGQSGGRWTLRRETGRWAILQGPGPGPAARATISEDRAWLLFFNAIPESEAAAALAADGDQRLLAPLMRARSVIV